MKLSGKTALVLGATGGIGRAVAETLSEAGAAVALHYYDWPERAEALRRDFVRRRHALFQSDLRAPHAATELIDNVIEVFTRLDILINNVERGGWPIVHGEYNRDQWDLEMETTLRAKRWIFCAALPHLQAGGEGAVVNLSSAAGVVGRSGPAGLVFNDGYAAANRAVSLFTESWARIGAPAVRVNEVRIGFVKTRHGPGTRGWELLTETERTAILDHTLLKRVGTPAEVARAVLFIVRDAPFMTGGVLTLDGGYLLGGEAVPPMPEGVE